jgi:hypothetical protein
VAFRFLRAAISSVRVQSLRLPGAGLSRVGKWAQQILRKLPSRLEPAEKLAARECLQQVLWPWTPSRLSLMPYGFAVWFCCMFLLYGFAVWFCGMVLPGIPRRFSQNAVQTRADWVRGSERFVRLGTLITALALVLCTFLYWLLIGYVDGRMWSW